MEPQYIDPTGKTVDLSSYGGVGAQNVEANKRNYSLAPITAKSIAPATAITIPEKPLPAPVDTTTGQAVIDTQTKTLTTPEKAPAEPTKPSAIESYLASLKAPTPLAETYQSAYEITGISTAEQDVLAKQKIVKTAQGKLATINAQLEALSAGATAESLKEESRFAPMFAIRGEQANIERQRAIQALPLQAQALAVQAEVQSAQGDVELAQNTMNIASNRLTTLFNMYSKDQENEYNYNKDLRDKVYEFATAKEKAQLDAMNKEDDRNFELMKDNINNAQALSKTALEAGQSDLAARITQLDPKSKTYREDLAALQGEIRVPQKVAVKAGEGAPVAGSPQAELAQAQVQSNISEIDALKTAKGLSKAVGSTFLARWTPFKVDVMTGEKANFIAGVEQMVSGLSLDALINAKSRGATFGALSEGEMKILSASASKIGTWRKLDGDGNVVGYSASEKAFKKELDRISNFAKLDYVLKGGDPSSVDVIVTPDGKLHASNSDGSITELR